VSNEPLTPPARTRIVRGLAVPSFFYGTAWKEDRTEALTRLAIAQGFRAIDTANQRKHYFEAGVGAALRTALASGTVTRDRLFLQTKFTFSAGQDARLPYDAHAPVPQQVEQSFQSSLEHLGTDYLDSYVLHGPSRSRGLGPADWDAWRAFEGLAESGRTRYLGVSNVSLEQLRALCDGARRPPAFVQNRCYARKGWDRDVRAFCSAQGIVYQGFSLLTANRSVTAHSEMARIAARHGRTVAQIVFRFALELGMVTLTGTTDSEHMRKDLEVFDFQLEPDEVERMERLAL
jgi:diketogulonate reductase-like aldo/keto reductase